MAAVYTNVEGVTFDAVTIDNVKSVTLNEEKTPLESQSDGARQGTIVGDMAYNVTATVEVEDTGIDYGTTLGLAGAGSLVFEIQLENAAATTKTITATNMVHMTAARSTDQANPGGITLTFRNKGADTSVSVA